MQIGVLPVVTFGLEHNEEFWETVQILEHHLRQCLEVDCQRGRLESVFINLGTAAKEGM